MGFFKSLFGGTDESPEEKKQRETEREVDVLKTDGRRALQMGQAEFAVKCFEKALQLKDELETRDYLAQALIRDDRLDEAMQQLSILHEAQPENVHILSLMAKVAFMMEDYGKMTELCEQAMLLEMGDLDGANEDADWLMERVEGVDDVMLLKARVLEAQHNDAEAIEVLSLAIERNPFLTDAYRLRGAARLRMGDKEGAADDAKKVLELHPEEMEGINGEF